MEITQQVHQPMEGNDWQAWLRTAEGIHILVQIGSDAHGQATEARAREIVAKIAASID